MPTSTDRVVLVIPCFNEERRLRLETFAAFSRPRGDIRLLFVDDGSHDGTAEKIESFSRSDASMELLRLPQNEGKAEAVRHGFVAAFAKQPRYIGYWDADLSMPLEAVSSFEEVLDTREEVEMVFASRVMLLGRDIETDPYRHYLGRVFATLAAMILRLPVYDTQCGAKLFRNTETLQEIFSQPFMSRWLLDMEILARLEMIRARTPGPPPQKCVYELPLERWKHIRGSKIVPTHLPRVAVELGRIYLALRASRRNRKRQAEGES